MFHIQYVAQNMHMVVLCFDLLRLYYKCSADSFDLFAHVLQFYFVGTGEVWDNDMAAPVLMK